MIQFVFVLGVLVATSAMGESIKTNNEMIKQCLEAYEYKKTAPVEERLNNFDWQSASDCVAGFNQERQKVKLAEQKEFLKKNPWYKGRNWNWEDRAEFTCHTEYHTGNVFCHRPKYIN